jgi:hypothetical protein
MEEAIAAISKLPESEQDLIAQSLLDEFEAEEKFDEFIAQNIGVAKRLAAEARAEIDAGLTEALDLDRL